MTTPLDDPEQALPAEGQMTLFEHLRELRKRVIYSIIAIFTGFCVCWTWAEDIFRFILVPLEKAAPHADMSKIHYKDLIEPFFTLVKTALVAGIFLAIPVVLYQIWKFVAPALYQDEKRLAIPFVFLATLFFFGGASFCYLFVMPFGFSFLFKFSQGFSNPMLMMSEHYALAMKLLLAFGAVFELPVISMFLSAMGVITHRTLIDYWRPAIIVSFVVAAILTPPDIGTQIAMAIPLIILYGVSIIVAYFFTKHHERKHAAMMAELEKP